MFIRISSVNHYNPFQYSQGKNTEKEKGLINIYTQKQKKIVRIASNRPRD